MFWKQKKDCISKSVQNQKTLRHVKGSDREVLLKAYWGTTGLLVDIAYVLMLGSVLKSLTWMTIIRKKRKSMTAYFIVELFSIACVPVEEPANSCASTGWHHFRPTCRRPAVYVRPVAAGAGRPARAWVRWISPTPCVVPLAASQSQPDCPLQDSILLCIGDRSCSLGLISCWASSLAAFSLSSAYTKTIIVPHGGNTLK